MTQSIVWTSIKYLLFDLIGDIIKFPLWWCTSGVKQAAVFCWRQIKEMAAILGIRIWLFNLFRPMFGQTDWQGRLISFFMRLVQLIVRLALMSIYLVLMIVVFFTWLAAPILAVYWLVTVLF